MTDELLDQLLEDTPKGTYERHMERLLTDQEMLNSTNAAARTTRRRS